jgi:hypothetical protein
MEFVNRGWFMKSGGKHRKGKGFPYFTKISGGAFAADVPK